MVHLKITSDNPDLSYVISKNPASGMIAKGIRKGTAFGWFNNNSYCLYFSDPPEEMSYSKQEFEYLDTSAYSSSLCYMNLLTDFFGTLMKADQEKDVITRQAVEIGLIKTKKSYLDYFISFFPDFSFFVEELAPSYFRICIEYEGKLRVLLHLVNLLSTFSATQEKDCLLQVDKDTVVKIARSLALLKCPYYIINLVKQKFLESKGLFDHNKQLLEESCREQIQLSFGTLLNIRKDWVRSKLSYSCPILVDLGCGGDLNYGSLSKKYDRYYAIDSNEEERQDAERRAKRKDYPVAAFLSSWQEAVDILDEPTEVLLSEVLEHMPFENSIDLLRQVLSHTQVQKVLVTLPNKQFNQFYAVEVRHSDHKWEVEREHLKTLLDVGLEHRWIGVHQSLGDCVNGIQPTVAICFERLKGEVY